VIKLDVWKILQGPSRMLTRDLYAEVTFWLLFSVVCIIRVYFYA